MAENNFRADMLENALSSYGILLSEDIKWDNEKMIKRLGDYFMEQEPEKYSWGTRYVQSLSTPMLCKPMKDELKNFKTNPVESDYYVAETKLNGMRCICVYSPEVGFEFFTRRESVTNYLNGNITDKYLFIEKGLITEPTDYKNKFPFRFVIDGELLVEGIEGRSNSINVTVEDYIQSIFSSSTERAIEFQKEGHRMKFMAFDVLYFEKDPKIPAEWTPTYDYSDVELTPDIVTWVEEHFKEYLEQAEYTNWKRAKKLYQYLASLKNSNKYDVRRYPFSKRRILRTKVINFLKSKQLPFYEVDGEDVFKTAFTDSILREGGEGSIIKCISAPYISGLKSSRNHRAAMKIKNNISDMLNSDASLMEDFDVFITGANPPKSERMQGMIGSLKCSVYIKKDDGSIVEHEIANVSGLSHEWKKKLASIDVTTGKTTLNPEYEGKVISINGLALTNSKLKFQHAVLKEKGNLEFKSKNPSECTWDEAVLKEMTLVRGK